MLCEIGFQPVQPLRPSSVPFQRAGKYSDALMAQRMEVFSSQPARQTVIQLYDICFQIRDAVTNGNYRYLS